MKIISNMWVLKKPFIMLSVLRDPQLIIIISLSLFCDKIFTFLGHTNFFFCTLYIERSVRVAVNYCFKPLLLKNFYTYKLHFLHTCSLGKCLQILCTTASSNAHRAHSVRKCAKIAFPLKIFFSRTKSCAEKLNTVLYSCLRMASS
jgi:hypothetical protein